MAIKDDLVAAHITPKYYTGIQPKALFRLKNEHFKHWYTSHRASEPLTYCTKQVPLPLIKHVP